MSDDRYAPVIRHVGIARTVLDRFEELARGPSGIGAFGEALAKAGARDYDRDAAQQLRTGEAGSIFGEVWTNLDAAARALTAAGERCARYADVRATQPASPLGLLANGDFNWGSARAAREAIAALETATPAIDWDAIKRADVALADEAARALGRGKHAAIAVIGGVLLALIVGAALVLHLVA